MKLKMLLVFATLVAVSNSQAAMVCKSVANDGIFTGEFMGSKSMTITQLNSAKVVLTFGVNGKFEGTFVKKARNGAGVYSCSSLTDVADQTDIGNILVSAELMSGHSGSLTLSTRQLGDSEGSSWLNEKFNCAAQ